MNNLIAVTIGDIEGIGIHLLLKEWRKRNLKNFVIISNYKIFLQFNLLKKEKTNLIENIKDLNYDSSKINILNFKTNNKFSNTYDSLNIAYKFTKKKYFIGILTLPLNKDKINKYVSKKFIDQTSFFSKIEKSKYANMIFIYKKKFFIPLTIHIEIKNVHKYFKNKTYMIKNIKKIILTLKNDFHINNPKILLAGINPHAGENGVISKDDSKYMDPIIKNLKKNNIIINGPVSGDSMINYDNMKYYDVFLFPYHDQALIPFKIVSNFEGVNFTSNLKIIRVSPSHGTARKLVGTNKATSNGIINCYKIIKKIFKNRK
tara:strand:+ start:9608 stop:10558 length:951 start_codon:yes stop_codon:yes gene_type:complete